MLLYGSIIIHKEGPSLLTGKIRLTSWGLRLAVYPTIYRVFVHEYMYIFIYTPEVYVHIICIYICSMLDSLNHNLFKFKVDLFLVLLKYTFSQSVSPSDMHHPKATARLSRCWHLLEKQPLPELLEVQCRQAWSAVQAVWLLFTAVFYTSQMVPHFLHQKYHPTKMMHFNAFLFTQNQEQTQTRKPWAIWMFP